MAKGARGKEYKCAIKLLTLKPRPTAIFAAGYLMAEKVMKAAEEMGLSIPDEISLVGFDDPGAGFEYSSMLTTVRQPVYELGRVAVLKLLELVENSDKPVTEYLLPEFIERKTCARIKFNK